MLVEDSTASGVGGVTASRSPAAGSNAATGAGYSPGAARYPQSRAAYRLSRALLVASLLVAILVPGLGLALWSSNAPSPADGNARPIATATLLPATPAPAEQTDRAPQPGALQPAQQDLTALSPELASYVAQQGGAMGVAIYDATRNRAYTYDDTTTFTLASSAKVYILCAYLDMVERAGRSPSSLERSQMQRMIEESDNNAAQWLFNRIGGAAGQQRYLAGIGIQDYVPRGRDWGWARLSPADMIHILTLLQSAGILTATDRSFALDLMSHVELGTWGVGDTAPRGAHVAMKDGWVTGPDGKWAQNSSGIVVVGGETYIISVYTAHQPRYDWSKIQHVCREVGELLTSGYD